MKLYRNLILLLAILSTVTHFSLNCQISPQVTEVVESHQKPSSLFKFMSLYNGCRALPEYNFITQNTKHVDTSQNITGSLFTYDFVINLLNEYLDDYNSQGGNGLNQPGVPFIKKIKSTDGYIAAIGDIHGSVHSVFRNMFNLAYSPEIGMSDDFKIINDKAKIIFTGDYIDRGNYGIETLLIAIILKLNDPDQIFLLRGNHEHPEIYANYNFINELITKFGEHSNAVLDLVSKVFDTLPSAVIAECGTNGTSYGILFCHGGIGIDAINELFKAHTNLVTNQCQAITQEAAFEFENMDFEHNTSENIFVRQSPKRGGDGLVCNGLAASVELKKYGINLVIRGHQHGVNLRLLFANEADHLKYKQMNSSPRFIYTADSDEPAHWGDVLKRNQVDSGGIIVEKIVPILTTSSCPDGGGQEGDAFLLIKIAPNFSACRVKLIATDFTNAKKFDWTSGFYGATIFDDKCNPNQFTYSYVIPDWTDKKPYVYDVADTDN